MPKIEVNQKLFFQLLGEAEPKDNADAPAWEALEERLVYAKAELDEKSDESLPQGERTIKIELNDTNRPDLWSTAGLARLLRLHRTGKQRDFGPLLSYPGKLRESGSRLVTVDEGLRDIRPFMTAFVISGKSIDEPMLLDIIQTQEKLCWNYGRKRKSISMGIYRSSLIKWPVHYKSVDPDRTSFVPLQCESPMTCRQILSDHPKGREYGWIIADKPRFPLLTDDRDEVLSMAPIINSATLGAVKVGDSDLLVEMTGTDMPSLLLATNIVACDFADAGYDILPCMVRHPYDTGFGRDICVPFYFQQPLDMGVGAMNRLLGSSLSPDEARRALERMGNTVTGIAGTGDSAVITLKPPPYRNDFLHQVDAIEDVMVGMTLEKFPPEKPRDFTIGRLTPVTLFSRKVKALMTGMGYQEFIFNYLGSKRDFIDNMGADAAGVIEIANPMSENYQFVRPSIIPSLLASEAGSGNAAYPHRIFETGKVAFLDPGDVTGTRTIQSLGFLIASGGANFNEAAGEVAALLYFLGHEYVVRESSDSRFIPGRQAEVLIRGKGAGVFGEVHPQVLENWAVTTPCAAGEINLEALMEA
ncbi:MAG: phenylalanine--tRNA ligase subunit beta [Spirochaetaceae bacterium]|jgi:phenylalanyl-tRNA synthetase beta chain|nr:phenylalanine--tRNA ligase subunit beta [Spirochaetaceae bacterium]